ncbi:rhomboid-related protein 4-like [Thalassophryne amazonica]|nr:rhomboid-related protein 4-like [Thalassophryne amazonica]
MMTCAGLVMSFGYHTQPPTYYSSSGSTGTGGRYSGGQPQTRDYTSNHMASYTGGLTEEEQLEAAIRNSMNDRVRTNERGAPPPYGFHVSEEPMTADELRRRRLTRFDR